MALGLRFLIGEEEDSDRESSYSVFPLFFRVGFELVLGLNWAGLSHSTPLKKKFRPQNLTYLYFQISVDISSSYHLQAPMWPLSLHNYSNESLHMK